MGQTVLDMALRMLIYELNADPTSAFVNTVTEDGKQGDDGLTECLLLADADVVRLYLANVNSPDREPFLEESDPLEHGETVVCSGTPDDRNVFVKVAPDGEFERSTRAPSYDQIRKWRRNLNNIYGPKTHDEADSTLGARHWLEGKTLYFTGSAAKMRLPQFSIDRDTPKCQSDERHSGLVVSRAINYAHKEGYASDWLFAKHEGLYNAGAALILAEGSNGP